MVLSTLDIYKLLQKNKYIYKNFLGVFSLNKLPYNLIHKPSILIINLDYDFLPGSHWVAICFDNKYGYYFDSFGNIPPDEIIIFLERNCKTFKSP